MPARLAVLEAEHPTHEIVLDAYGFTRNLADEIEEAGVPLRRLETSDVTAACATLISLVGEDQLRHLGDPDLLRALDGAATRSYRDAWLWARRTSIADVTPLVAATNAAARRRRFPEDFETPSGEPEALHRTGPRPVADPGPAPPLSGRGAGSLVAAFCFTGGRSGLGRSRTCGVRYRPLNDPQRQAFPEPIETGICLFPASPSQRPVNADASSAAGCTPRRADRPSVCALELTRLDPGFSFDRRKYDTDRVGLVGQTLSQNAHDLRRNVFGRDGKTERWSTQLDWIVRARTSYHDSPRPLLLHKTAKAVNRTLQSFHPTVIGRKSQTPITQQSQLPGTRPHSM